MIPLAVIGGGQIGLRHAGVAVTSDRVRLVAVVEPHAATRDRLAAQGLPVLASLEDLPKGTVAAIVATPTQDHCATAMAALDLGLALIVEKPLTATPDEGRALIAHAAAKGLPLYCGHHRRCHPFVQAARAVLADLGPLVGAQALWSLRKPDGYHDLPWRRAPGAGPLMTNLSHEIDLLRFLLGEVAEVTALTAHCARGLPVEDTAALAFRMESGALVSVLISDAGASPWAFEAATGENPDLARSGEDYLRLTGTKGALAFPSMTLWRGDDWRQAMVRQEGRKFAPVDPLLEQVNRFAAVLEGAEDDVLCSARDGQAAADWTLATALAARRGHPVTRGDLPGDYRGD